MITLKEYYKTSVVPELKEKLGLDSVMAVPKVTKITINMGVGEALNDKKVLESAVEDMTLIAGQKPLVTKQGSLLLISRYVMVCLLDVRSR